MTDQTNKKWFLGRIFDLPNDDPKKTVTIAILLCLACSILVSTTAVMLKSKQSLNKETDIKKNILAVSGHLDPDGDINQMFERFEVKAIDLATGDYADIDTSNYDQRKAASDPTQSIKLTAEQDIAGIGRRAKVAMIYLLKEDGKLKQVVLPIHGYGLWSTLYGFIALESDFNTIKGLQFYSHAETPGLGGEVDNPKWRGYWKGKKIFDQNGELKIEVVRGNVDYKTAGAEHKVDGLSGATLTSKGVSNLVNYWLGAHGFGPYLNKMRASMEN